MNKLNLQLTSLVFSTFIFLVIISCESTPHEELIYTEKDDFILIEEISQGLGYDSILISKGDYPISFEKNKNGQLSLKVVKTFGNGNGLGIYETAWRGKRKSDFNCNGDHCWCWGFSCKGYSGPRIMSKFSLTNDNLLTIDFLEKVPFGEEGYILEK